MVQEFDTKMDEILKVAIDAARAGGDIINANATRISSLNIEQKSLNDFVSEVDRQSEIAVKVLIHKSFPDHAFIGEEYGASGRDESEYTWHVDPLDGTTNFLRSIPHYCVSIGVCYLGVPYVAVVFDPVKKELYTAIKGQGAYLNDKPIAVAQLSNLNGALLATGVPFSGAYLDKIDSCLGTMNGVLHENTSGIRRLGSAALDLAYVAAGRYDGYWEAGLKSWDICAGLLLVQEAGGITSDLLGQPTSLFSGDVLAANRYVHAAMLTVSSVHYRPGGT